jgi:hypothetical protein
MKEQTKMKKSEQFREIIRIRYLAEPLKLINKHFPKGNKFRGEAMALMAVTFTNAWMGGIEYIERTKKYTSKYTKSQSKHKGNNKL